MNTTKPPTKGGHDVGGRQSSTVRSNTGWEQVGRIVARLMAPEFRRRGPRALLRVVQGGRR